jgi:hypothetical protein
MNFSKFWFMKWTVSNKELLEEISEEDREREKNDYEDANLSFKVLGKLSKLVSD